MRAHHKNGRAEVATCVIALCLAVASCEHKATFSNLSIRYPDSAGKLVPGRTDDQSTRYAVQAGEITSLSLTRLCFADIGSWLGGRKLTIGITLDVGGTEKAKGVVNAEDVWDGECVQVRDKTIIDPFKFQASSYLLKVEVIELPADSLKTLVAITNTVIAAASYPPTTPMGKIGSALYDGFIKPAVEKNKVLVRYEQGFRSADMGESESRRVLWQTGALVILPEKEAITIDGKVKNYDVPMANLVLDHGDLKVSAGKRYTGAPYFIFEVTQSRRGSGAAVNAVSAAVQNAATAIVDSRISGVAADVALKKAQESMAENYSALTQWAVSMFMEFLHALDQTQLALTMKGDDNDVLVALKGAKSRCDGIRQKFYAGTPKVRMTEEESETLKRVESALDDRQAPLLAAAQKRQQDAEARAAAEKKKFDDAQVKLAESLKEVDKLKGQAKVSRDFATFGDVAKDWVKAAKDSSKEGARLELF